MIPIAVTGIAVTGIVSYKYYQSLKTFNEETQKYLIIRDNITTKHIASVFANIPDLLSITCDGKSITRNKFNHGCKNEYDKLIKYNDMCGIEKFKNKTENEKATYIFEKFNFYQDIDRVTLIIFASGNTYNNN
jgi:hypothetical protein